MSVPSSASVSRRASASARTCVSTSPRAIMPSASASVRRAMAARRTRGDSSVRASVAITPSSDSGSVSSDAIRTAGSACFHAGCGRRRSSKAIGRTTSGSTSAARPRGTRDAANHADEHTECTRDPARLRQRSRASDCNASRSQNVDENPKTWIEHGSSCVYNVTAPHDLAAPAAHVTATLRSPHHRWPADRRRVAPRVAGDAAERDRRRAGHRRSRDGRAGGGVHRQRGHRGQLADLPDRHRLHQLAVHRHGRAGGEARRRR